MFIKPFEGSKKILVVFKREKERSQDQRLQENEISQVTAINEISLITENEI